MLPTWEAYGQRSFCRRRCRMQRRSSGMAGLHSVWLCGCAGVVRRLRCSGCSEIFGVTALENEMDIECPHCGKGGLVKLPPSKTRHTGSRVSGDKNFEGDGTDGPQVRIIKDIRDL